MKRTYYLNNIFVIIFFLIILIPLCCINTRDGIISETENRKLEKFPCLFDIHGKINKSFLYDFEKWFNDNIGFREKIVSINNRFFIYIFNKIDDNIFYMLGPGGELNFVDENILEDWHHLNIPDDEYLRELAESYQYVDDFLSGQHIQFYRMQCWDKHTIYPEQFPKYALQYGKLSRTDVIVETINTKTNVNQPDYKDKLLEKKKEYAVYPTWGDPSHWSERGAFIGYCAIMEAINDENNNKFRILSEADFDIVMKDVGLTILGGIHKDDYIESFSLKNSSHPHSDLSHLTLFSDDLNSNYYLNDHVDNKEVLLIVGDSYIKDFLLPYFAESFYKVIFIQGNHMDELFNIVEEYKPSIVIHESAERTYAYRYVIKASEVIKEKIGLEE